MSSHDEQPAPARRSVLRTAAWATPVIAVAAATPAAAASVAVPPDEANFVWKNHKQFDLWDNHTRARLEVGVEFKPRGGVQNPGDGQVQVTISFAVSDEARDVTVSDISTSGWTVSPSEGSSSTLVFTRPAGWDLPLNFRFDVTGDPIDDPSDLVATASMQVLGGGAPTWSNQTIVIAATERQDPGGGDGDGDGDGEGEEG